MPVLKVIFTMLLFLTTIPSLAQDSTETDKQEEKLAAKTVEIADVWKLHAVAVSSRFNLDDVKRDAVTKIYLEVRTNLAERIRQFRAMEEQNREDRIEQSRQNGTYIVQTIDDMAFLQRRIYKVTEEARKKLAESLVEIAGKGAAARIFPPLAAFDLKVDNLIKLIIEEEFEDKKAYSAINAIDIYFAESVKARAKIRSDKKAFILANNAARNKLVTALTPLVTEDTLKKVSRMVGIKKAPKKRTTKKRGG